MAPKGGRPNPEKVRPRRVRATRVGGPKISRFCFLLPSDIPLFLLSLGSSRGILVVDFSGTKRAKWWREREKKKRIMLNYSLNRSFFLCVCASTRKEHRYMRLKHYLAPGRSKTSNRNHSRGFIFRKKNPHQKYYTHDPLANAQNVGNIEPVQHCEPSQKAQWDIVEVNVSCTRIL